MGNRTMCLRGIITILYKTYIIIAVCLWFSSSFQIKCVPFLVLASFSRTGFDSGLFCGGKQLIYFSEKSRWTKCQNLYSNLKHKIREKKVKTLTRN